MPGIIVITGHWAPGNVKPATPARPPRSKQNDLVILRAGIDIALQYFNTDDQEAISVLTTKARNWADRYFGHRFTKRPTFLLKSFPDLFNLRVPAHLRLAPAAMPSPSRSPEPEGVSLRDLRRAEREDDKTEAFVEYAEPTLASDADIDNIVDLRARQPKGAIKPAMRVDASMLRDSGLLYTLPDFLGQLARANLETETLLANDPNAVRLELDDDQAAEQPHVEMNLFSGMVEEAQRRRKQRRLVLPNGRPLELPGGVEGANLGDSQSDQGHSNMDEDSGDETDASTSTTASLHANLRKRKAESSSDAGESSPPNKIRLHYQYPPPELRRFDMKRRKLITTPNPNAVPNDPFAALNSEPATQPPASPTPSADSTGSSSSSSSGGPTRIIKIRVPCSNSSNSSRASSPDSQGSRIIVLRDPRHSAPSSSASNRSSSSPRPMIKLRSPKKDAESGTRGASRSSSPGSDGSASSSRSVKIKVVKRSKSFNERLEEAKEGKKRLIEEVEE